ncbi:syntaxin-binding protein [Acrasis kona]|uniref:Syntaxin-binding protein n=1 Tax=Acrasis kona TaxID=1008807 RepID=A0AAW2Z9Y3_9EUKA
MKKLLKKLTSKKDVKETVETASKNEPKADNIQLEKNMNWKMQRISLNGVPHHVTCAAYDCIQGTLALGTSAGTIQILGQSGVEHYIHPKEKNLRIQKLIFATNTGNLIGSCSDDKHTFIKIWSLHYKESKYRIDLHDMQESEITDIFHQTGSVYFYVSSYHDGVSHIHAINISTGEISTVYLQKVGTKITCMEVHPFHDHIILFGLSDGTCAVHNLLKREPTNFVAFSHPVIESAVTCVSWSPDVNDLFVCGYHTGETIKWELKKPLLQALHEGVLPQNAPPVQTPLTVLRNKEQKINSDRDSIFVAVKGDALKTITNKPSTPKSNPIKETFIDTKQDDPHIDDNQELLPDENIPSEVVVYNAPAPPTSSNNEDIPLEYTPVQTTKIPPMTAQMISMEETTTTTAQTAPSHQPTTLSTKSNIPSLPVTDQNGIYKYSATKNTPQKPDPVLVCDIEQMILLLPMVPYPTSNHKLKYAGIIHQSQFSVVDLEFETAQLIKHYNFHHPDGSNITNIHLIENVGIMNQILKDQKKMSAITDGQINNKWPIDGGIFNLTSPHQSKLNSHILTTTHQDGSAALWTIGGTQSGGIVKICNLHSDINNKKVKCVTSWSQCVIGTAFDDGSISFIDLDGLQSSTLSNYRNGIKQICMVPTMQQVVIAYDDLSVELVDMTSASDSMSITSRIELSNSHQSAPNVDSIACMEITPVDHQGHLLVMLGFQSGRLTALDLNSNLEVVYDSHPSSSPFKSNSSINYLFAIDEHDCSPCVVPDRRSMPSFMKSQKYQHYQSKNKNLCYNLLFAETGSDVSEDAAVVPVFNVNHDQVLNDLVIDLHLQNGLKLTDASFELTFSDDLTSEVVIKITLGPGQLKVGHGRVDYEFDIDLDDLHLIGECRRLIIMHDINTHKYRAYTFKDPNSARHDILGVVNYNEGDDIVEELVQMCNAAEQDQLQQVRKNVFNKVDLQLVGDFIPERSGISYSTKQEYLKSVVTRCDVFSTKKFTTVNDILKSIPDVSVCWNEEQISECKYLVQVREFDLNCSKIKMKKNVLKVENKFKSSVSAVRFVQAKHTFVDEHSVVITIDAQHVVRAFSVPKLQCLTKHSMNSPQLLSGVIINPTCLETDKSGLVVFANGSDQVLQCQMIDPEQDVMYVTEPTLYIPNRSFLPEKTPPPIIGNVATGLFNRFLNKVASKIEDRQDDRLTPLDHDNLHPINLSRELEFALSQNYKNHSTIKVKSMFVASSTFDRSLERELDPSVVKHVVNVVDTPAFTYNSDIPPIPIQLSKEQADRITQQAARNMTKKERDLFGEAFVWDKNPTSKTASASNKVNDTKLIMSENLNKVNERGEKLSQLSDRTAEMSNMARTFAQNTERLKQKQTSWW